jgi:hypothetical protein
MVLLSIFYVLSTIGIKNKIVVGVGVTCVLCCIAVLDSIPDVSDRSF